MDRCQERTPACVISEPDLFANNLSLVLKTCSTSLFIGFLFSWFHSPVRAQIAGDSFEFTRADWHLAEISETQKNWRNSCDYYQKVIEESKPLPLDVREWYRGTAYYGIARCESRMDISPAVVRLALSRAFSHHFWNFALLASDADIVAKCGNDWLDSNRAYWLDVFRDEHAIWMKQEPIFFYPKGYDSTAKWPLIVALHGGNGCYECFAEYWKGMADDLHAVIAVPAGAIRESQITNSWGSDMSIVGKPVLDLVADISSKHLADPSQVYLMGFSQGAQASIELTLLHPDIFRGAVAMSGFVDRTISDSILNVARERKVKIYAVSGEMEDPMFRAELDTIRDHCTGVGIPFDLKRVLGMLHEVPLDFHSQILAAWNWLRPTTEAARAKEE